jgi:AraC-like DNA-binding protein
MLKYVNAGTHGEISALPDHIFSIAPEAGCNGISFIDFAYTTPGHSTHSVVGLQIGVGTAATATSLDFTGAVQERLSGASAFILRGPGHVGHSTWDGDYRARFLLVTPNALERVLQIPLSQLEMPPIIADIGEYERIGLLLAALTAHPADGQTDPLFVESVALAIIRATGLVSNEEIGKTPTLSITQADRLRDLITSQLTHSLSLRDMANAVGLSESYFVRAFKGSFGVTPYQYVLRERVALAQSLISVGELSLTEIAQLSGFPDARRMGRTFKQVTGRSPTGATKTKRKTTH